MFELIKTPATIRSVSPRAENHGDEHALAIDIGLEYSLSNQKLELLQPGLCSALYQRDRAAESEAQGAFEIEEGMLPHLRFADMGAFPWDYKGEGYTFELINDALHGEQKLTMRDCKVNAFKVEPEEGGTIKLRVRVQCLPNEEDIGELCSYLKEKVAVSLIPPSVDDAPQADIEDEYDFEGEAA